MILLGVDNMDNYQYKITEIKKMLFSELVLAWAINHENNQLFYDEILKRLNFCEFEDEMIENLIAYELEILKATKKIYDRLLINKFWWISDLKSSEQNSNKTILEPPFEQYLMYYNGKISNKALTNSEIVSLYDESCFVIEHKENFSQLIVNECLRLSQLEYKENLRDQFIHRIDYIYKRELNKEYNLVIFNKAMRFLTNELHIVFINKYQYDIPCDQKWKAYTNNYFNHYEY